MCIGSTRQASKRFGRTVDRLKTLPVLLIVTYRPEFEPPWIGQPHVSALTLNRLGEREIACHDRPRHGQQTTAGEHQTETLSSAPMAFPLFVEEMTKAVLEAESEDEAQQTAARNSVFGSGSPCKPACLADGATGPTWPR